MFSIMNWLAPSVHFFARGVLLVFLLTLATTGSGASAAGWIFLVGCILALLVVIGVIVLIVVLLARRKQAERVQVGVPTEAGYPMQQMPPPPGQGAYPGFPSYGAGAAMVPPVAAQGQQPPTPAQPVQQTPLPPAQSYQPQTPPSASYVPATEAVPGSAAVPTTPMRRCLNGHIVTDPAAIFCAECGAGIQQPRS